MEISKMLTLCTNHVTDKTLRLLDDDANANDFPCLSIYKKEDYGYFIYINKNEFRNQCAHGNMPGDLIAVISFTIESGCDILCLDSDGEELVCLPHYEYFDTRVNGHDVSRELCYCGGNLIGEKFTDYRV